ncbi:MAG: DUF6644 family protein [Vicinamibacterales bacterium]
MSLLPLFEWFESTGPGLIVRESVWLFPVIEATHLLGLCLLGGALLVVDLRLLGAGLTATPVATLARHARPWLVAAVTTLAVTGVLLFLSEAVKCYYNQSFWVKITTFPIALAFTFAVRQRVIGVDGVSRATERLTGAVSLLLWFVVAAAGRWIGFS